MLKCSLIAIPSDSIAKGVAPRESLGERPRLSPRDREGNEIETDTVTNYKTHTQTLLPLHAN